MEGSHFPHGTGIAGDTLQAQPQCSALQAAARDKYSMVALPGPRRNLASASRSGLLADRGGQRMVQSRFCTDRPQGQLAALGTLDFLPLPTDSALCDSP